MLSLLLLTSVLKELIRVIELFNLSYWKCVTRQDLHLILERKHWESRVTVTCLSEGLYLRNTLGMQCTMVLEVFSGNSFSPNRLVTEFYQLTLCFWILYKWSYNLCVSSKIDRPWFVSMLPAGIINSFVWLIISIVWIDTYCLPYTFKESFR